MNETVISVAEAAVDLRKFVERAQAESVSFVMTENGIPVARIVPEKEKICTGGDLAQMLAQIKDIPTDFADWREDLRAGKSALLPPRDKWE
jgi:antitoxin (DNA-binding transcriptional repressor) of toxin-antitoxin stability system